MQDHHKINVSVDLRLSDMLRASYWFFFSRWSTRLMLATSIPVGASIIVVLSLDAMEPSRFIILCTLVMLLAPVFLMLNVYLQARRNFSNLKGFQKRLRFIFSAGGYDVGDEKSFSHVSWDSVVGAVETTHSFNLFFHKSLFQVIPKRCFRDSGEIGGLRALLGAGVGAKAKLLNE